MAIRLGKMVRTLAAGSLVAYATILNASVVVNQSALFGLTPAQVRFLVVNNGVSATNSNNGPQGASQALSFLQFDPTLGTLTGVTISFMTTFNATSNLFVTERANDSAPPVFFADGSLSFKLSGTSLIPDQLSSQAVSANCGFPNPVLSTATCSDNQSISGNFNSSISGASLAPFIGSGNLALTAELSDTLAPRVAPDNGTGYSDNATMEGTLIGSWDGSVSVAYTYDVPPTPAPEPVTLYLLAAGLGGIVFYRRRRALVR